MGPRRWSPIIGLFVPLILTMGSIVASATGNQFLDQPTEPAEVGILAGTVVQTFSRIPSRRT